MLSKKKTRRKAAVMADQRRIEGQASGKTVLARLKAEVLGASHTFESAQNVFLDAINHEQPADVIEYSKKEFDTAFESYSQRIAQLIAHCVANGNTKIQEDAAREYKDVQKMHRETKKQYRELIAEERSMRSSSSRYSLPSNRSRRNSVHSVASNASGGSQRAASQQRNDGGVHGDASDTNVASYVNNLDLQSNVGDSYDNDNELAATNEQFDAEDYGGEHGDDHVKIAERQRSCDSYSKLPSRVKKKSQDGNPASENTTIDGSKVAAADTAADAASSSVQAQTKLSQLGTDMWKQLNRVSIPTFSGDKKNYESWKAAFYTCVDAAPATAEYKLLQLRHYLKGEALKSIESLGHSSAAYEAAKERLERKFGGERRRIALRLEEIDNFRPMKDGSAKEMDRFADVLDLLVINLKETGQHNELGCGSLYVKTLKKMTETMISSYRRWLKEHSNNESIETLREWVNEEAEFRIGASETLRGLGGRSSAQTNPTFYGADEDKKPARHKKNFKNCIVCSKSHVIWKCKEFLAMDVKERWSIAREKRLCYRCLSSDHRGVDCPRTSACGINDCQNTHSRLLHREETDAKKATEPEQDADDEEFSHTAMGEGPTSIALRTIPVIVRNGEKAIAINALLDDGSTRTYINADVAAELGLLTGETDEITVGTMGGAKRTFASEAVSFVLESADRRTSRSVQAFTATNVTGAMKTVEWKKFAPDWKHLKNLKFPSVAAKKTVDMLIGIDQAELHVAIREVRGKVGEPIARLTPLGWTAVGRIGKPTNDESSSHTANLSYFVNGGMAEINRNLERFWEIEEPGNASAVECMSNDEQAAYEIVANSMRRSTNSKYEISMPWKGEHSNIPNNIETAKKRLACTEKSIRKRGLGDNYKNIIEQYLKKGYIRKVAKDDRSGRWYLPHFAISRPDKSTTKTRIVFDASARHEGVCLNDFIHKGPKLQRDLLDVLLRFRRAPVAIVCDVAEMYLQIEIREEDRLFHRFLWRDMKIEKLTYTNSSVWCSASTLARFKLNSLRRDTLN